MLKDTLSNWNSSRISCIVSSITDCFRVFVTPEVISTFSSHVNYSKKADIARFRGVYVTVRRPIAVLAEVHNAHLHLGCGRYPKFGDWCVSWPVSKSIQEHLAVAVATTIADRRLLYSNMTLQGCHRGIKYTLFVFNFFFWVSRNHLFMSTIPV